jgi:hypothetical protein
MCCPRRVKGPSEVYAGSNASFRDALKQFALILDVIIFGPCDQMDRHLVCRRFALDDHFYKFHHVPCLIEKPEVGVGHYDAGSTLDVRTKELVVADTLSVFCKDMVPLLEFRRRSRRKRRLRRRCPSFNDIAVISVALILCLWAGRRL